MRDDDDVEPWRDLVATENLSYQSFGSISTDRPAKLLRRRNSQPADAELVGPEEHGAVAAVDPNSLLVNSPELRVLADPFGRPKLHSLLTVSRFRPFARRRFSTRRPFLVLMRTKNPCVRFRWRVLG